MKSIASIFTVSLAFLSVLALPLTEQSLDRRQGAPVYLRAKSNVATRYEIRQLRDQQPNQYALFVLAIQALMKKSSSDPTSYWQIAGIHGVPRDTYNGVQHCANGKCDNTDGYAVHNSVLFPTWHRAYLALFEQELTAAARQIASQYPSSQRNVMQKAANALRLPYYDAAAAPKQGSPAFPNLLTDTRVTVNGPKGRMTLDNPLARYNIPDTSRFAYQYFTAWPHTLRWPQSNDPGTASQDQLAKNALANARQNLADQFYNLFTNCHDWLHFSNDHAGSSIPSCATNIETIHNGIHTTIGGPENPQTRLSGGHMTYLSISSFEPAFWLHHANIDRIFAMWQTLNPSSWGNQQSQKTASWTIPIGAVVGAKSPLTPFLKESGGTNPGGFWNSELVRNWRNLGYTYPEYAHSSGSASDITRYINGLYGPDANAVAGSSKRDGVIKTPENAGQTDHENPTTTASGTAGSISSPPTRSPLVANNGSIFQYVANIYTPRYSLNGTYQVYLFNGEPSSNDGGTWLFEENLIGFMGVLSKPNMMDNDLIISGSIPLTRTLQAVLRETSPPPLVNLSEDMVVPYLARNLVWKVSGPNGIVDPGTINGFVISIYASTAPTVPETELPVWSPFIPLLEITRNQSGGANSTADSAISMLS